MKSEKENKRTGLRSEWGYGTVVFLVLLFLALLAIPKSGHTDSPPTAQNPENSGLILPSQDLDGMSVPIQQFAVVKNVKIL
jgi:hypothetical protein